MHTWQVIAKYMLCKSTKSRVMQQSNILHKPEGLYKPAQKQESLESINAGRSAGCGLPGSKFAQIGFQMAARVVGDKHSQQRVKF